MAWTTPRTWVGGEVVTASIMNTYVRDNQLEIRNRHPRVLFSLVSLVTNSGSSETSAFSRTLPANTVTTGQSLRILMGGHHAANGNSKVIRLKLNSATVSFLSTGNGSTQTGWWAEFLLGCASNTVARYGGVWNYRNSSGDLTVSPEFGNHTTVFNSDQTLEVTLQGVSNSDLSLRLFWCELVSAEP